MAVAEKVFGKRIKQLRKQHRLTQSELGEMVGLTQQSITAWETGRTYPDVYTLIRLAMLYEVSVDWLLGLTENAEPGPMLVRRNYAAKGGGSWDWQLSAELRQAIQELIRQEARETLLDPDIATHLSPSLVEKLLNRIYGANQSISGTTCAGGESKAAGERK